MNSLTRVEQVVIGALTVAVVAAGALHYLEAPTLLAFGVATVALAGIAWLVAFATEQVGQRFGPAITGFLQSTLGNLPEFFVVLFALGAGHVVVAQFSLIGSIFANALLVLGLVVLAGARKAPDGVMRFHPRLPNDTSTLLFVTVFLIVIVGSAAVAGGRAGEHVVSISSIGAIAILGVYLTWLVPYLRADKPRELAHETRARVPFRIAVGLLAFGGVSAALVSDWFVAELEPAIEALRISEEFAGLVIVAIAGNAVENVTGIILAHKGHSDLAISVVKNSVAQIAAFLFPALVLISLLFAEQLTFELAPIYIGALLVTAIVMWQTTGDGAAPAFEGWALISVYVILATVTLFE